MATAPEEPARDVAERALDTARALVIVVDRSARVLIINRFARELLGWSAEEVRGRDAIELLVPEVQRVQARVGLERSLAGQPLDGAIRPVRLRDGGIRLVRWSAAETLGPDGEVDGLVYVGHDVTERERVRALLERGEKLARMGTWENEEDGTFWVSPGMRRIFGIPEDVAGGAEELRALVHPGDRARLEARLAQALEEPGGDPLEIDFRIVRRDGELRHLHSESHFDPVTRVRRGILLDVTEGHLAQQELRASEKRLRALFNQRIELAGFVSLDGLLLEANERALAYVGAKREDVVLHPFWETPWWCHDPELQARLREAVARAAAGEFVRFAATHPRTEGGLGSIDFSLSPVRGPEGRPELLFAEGVDVTRELEAESALARTRERNVELLELLDAAPDGYYVLDARTHRFLWASSAAQRNLGYGSEELSRMSCADLSPDLGLDRLCELLAPLERGETDLVELDTEHVRRDGSRYPIHVRYTRGRYRGAPALLAVAVETSERRRLEAQLLQAQKLEALGTLAGGVAHDFNNLLTSVRGSAELLLRHAEPGGSVERAARRVLMAAERGQQLTGQLLGFSRPKQQQQERVDLSTSVREVHELLSRTLGEDIRFELELQADTWPVLADPGEINQLLVNLIVNARDAMPGGGTLSVATANAGLDRAAAAELELAAGDYVRLRVRDTGAGMPPEVKAQIFDPFFTTKGPGKGTGLGLATVLAIVQRHRGRIRVESEEGRGTAFDVWLPRDTAREAESKPPGPILLLIRDAILRDLVGELLEDRGYRVVACASPDEAVHAAEGGAIDLWIADVPCGSEPLASALRAHSKPRALYLSSENGLDAQAPENASVIAKPFKNEVLLAKVRELLGR